MNADPKLDAALRRQAGIALDHTVLHFDGAAHGVNHAAELDQVAVLCAPDDAAVMQGDGRIDQVAAQRPEPPQNAILVHAGEPAVADDIRDHKKIAARFYAFPPWRTLWASLRIARKPVHSGVYSRLTCAPARIAINSACASAISGISSVGEKPSSAGARTA